MGVRLLFIQELHAQGKTHQWCASRLSDRETIGEQSFKLPLPDRSHGEMFLLSVVETIYLKGEGGEVGGGW